MNLILNFIKKEFLQFKRDKRMFAVILIAPVVQLIFLGYAATLDVKDVKTVVWDQDRSETSREFLEKYEKSGYFTLQYNATSYNEISNLIDKGEVVMAMIIPPDFEKDVCRLQKVLRKAKMHLNYTAIPDLKKRFIEFKLRLICYFIKNKTNLKPCPCR